MGRAAIATLLIAALPAGAELDGGLPPAVFAARAQLQLPGDAGWVESECFPFDGGTACSGGWLPLPRLEANAGEVAGLRGKVKVLSADVPLFSTPAWVFIAITNALALIGGIYFGWELHSLFR